MKIFNRIKNKNNESTKIDIQKSFEENLKYISNTEKKVEIIKNQFKKTATRYYLTVGEINCPTGKIIVSDPLTYLALGEFCPTLELKIPVGKYPIEVSICKSNEIGIRMCTARLKIKDSEAITYKIANSTEESAVAKGKDGILSGFPVDAGMISFCDEQVGKENKSFLDKWHQDNPKGNHYDDYFAQFFKESENRLPQFQREGGDFIEWKNPESENKLVMIASGLGDGFYQSYWGYDSNNEICELIVPLVNPELFGL